MILHSLFDLLSESSSKIERLFKGMDISDKELSLLHAVSTASAKAKRLTPPSQPALGFKEVQKRNINAFRHCLNILKKVIKVQEEEFATFVAHQEKLAQKKAALREHKLKHAAEKRRQDLQAFLDQAFKLELEMLEEVNRSKAEAYKFYEEIIAVQQNLTDNMAKIKSQKHEVLEEYTQNYAQSLHHYISPTGVEYFKALSSEQKQAFLKDFFYQDRKLEKTITKEKRKQAAIERELDKLFEQRRNLLHQLVVAELQGRINVSQTKDSLKPQRLTLMHGMARQGLKDERVRELDDKIRALSTELKASVDKMGAAKSQKEHLLTTVARKHHLDPLANASKEEQSHFLTYCSKKQEKIYAEMDKCSDLRQKHKRQKEKLQKTQNELESSYNGLMKDGAIYEQSLNARLTGTIDLRTRDKVKLLSQESHALDQIWQVHATPMEKRTERQHPPRDFRLRY